MKPTGLTNQVRRAAVSISAHIAGGPGRIDTVGFAQVRSIVPGCLDEVETRVRSASRPTHTGNVTSAVSHRKGGQRKAGRPVTRGRDRLSLRRTA